MLAAGNDRPCNDRYVSTDGVLITDSVLDRIDAVEMDGIKGIGDVDCKKVELGIKVGPDDFVLDVDCKDAYSTDDDAVVAEESLVKAVEPRD